MIFVRNSCCWIGLCRNYLRPNDLRAIGFHPKENCIQDFRLSEFYARFSFWLLVFTPKRTKLYMAMAMPRSHRILLGLRRCSIAVNLWNFHQITKWNSSESWALSDRPTLRSLLIAKASHSFHLILHHLHCFALRRKAKDREVLRRKMPRARKVLSCEKLKAEKSFSAKCWGQGKFFGAKHWGHCNKYETLWHISAGQLRVSFRAGKFYLRFPYLLSNINKASRKSISPKCVCTEALSLFIERKGESSARTKRRCLKEVSTDRTS